MKSLKLLKVGIEMSLSLLFINSLLADSVSESRLLTYQANNLIPASSSVTTEGATGTVYVFNQTQLSWATGDALLVNYGSLLNSFGELARDDWEDYDFSVSDGNDALAYLSLIANGAHSDNISQNDAKALIAKAFIEWDMGYGSGDGACFTYVPNIDCNDLPDNFDISTQLLSLRTYDTNPSVSSGGGFSFSMNFYRNISDDWYAYGSSMPYAAGTEVTGTNFSNMKNLDYSSLRPEKYGSVSYNDCVMGIADVTTFKYNMSTVSLKNCDISKWQNVTSEWITTHYGESATGLQGLKISKEQNASIGTTLSSLGVSYTVVQ